jgi:outer membrane protein assembly factor BamB
VHISAICPHCETRYQLEPGLRGKRIRCQNRWCQAIFEVRDEAEAAPPAPREPEPAPQAPPRQVVGSVGDIVPILTAEQVEPVAVRPPAPPPPAPAPVRQEAVVAPVVTAEAAPPPREVPKKVPKPTWQEPPPVRQRPAAAPEPAPVVPHAPTAVAERPTAQLPVPDLDWGPLGAFFNEEAPPSVQPDVSPTNGPAVEPAGPVELAPGTWEAPPIRLPGLASGGAVAPEAPPAPAAGAPEVPSAVVSRRRSRKAIGFMAAAVGVVLAVAGLGVWSVQRNEAENEAKRLEQAEQRYTDHNFEDATQRFNKLYADYPDSPNRPLYRFLAEFSSLRDPVYSAQLDAEEAGNALGHLQQFVAGYKDDPLVDRYQGDLWDTFYKLSGRLTEAAEEKHNRALLTQAQAALAQAKSFKVSEDVPAQPKMAEARKKQDEVNEKIVAFERKEAVLARVKGAVDSFSFAAMQEAIATARERGLNADPDVAKLIAELPAKHRDSVRYTVVEPGKLAALPPEEQEPSLLVVPVVKPHFGEVEAETRVVLALARGVLYALEPGRGRLRWAARVSIDTADLPVRVPRTPIAPELVLVLAPDSYTLTALDAERGTPVWRHRLKAACLGNPVLVGNRAFVPTDQGFVEEIETTEGRPLGYYDLGQPLPVGGVHEPGTNRVYFPADSHSIYILDVAARTCAGILYAGHPEGSLRGPPVIVPEPARPGGNRPVDASLVLCQEDGLDKVKLRVFPLPITDPEAGQRQAEKPLSGWSWFPPFCDGERLAQVTDAGRFGLFGIEARGRDAVHLFDLVKGETVLGGGGPASGRAQIVHADAEHFWVLADGWLHKLLLTFDRQAGPKLVARQLGVAPLGSALHAGQVRTDTADKTMLFLVSQVRDAQTCLASAMGARRGTLYWQRQLGLVSQGQPVRLGEAILVQDQGGGVFRFDPARLRDLPGNWHLAGQRLTIPLANSTGPTYFLSAPDGASVVAVTCTEATTLVVRQFQAGRDAPTIQKFQQQAPLGGTPGLGTGALVLPLGNGILVRQALAGGPAVSGPNWRAAHAEVDALGFVVPLGGDDFLVTDGSRGLKRLHWPGGNMAEARASSELPSRIVAAPVVLPPDAATGDVRIAVADAANTVTLLQGDGLRTARQWPMAGKITAGPFVRGKGIGCVVDHRRLVWLDPDKDRHAWEYAPPADIVGEPQLVKDDLLVVADLSGHFAGFDLTTGQEPGPGYTLRANVAPAAAPLAFGNGRLFAPLTDGTVLLLSEKHFR